ncbi:hypothetical protein BDZ91DRAFT_730972 [Kalaharituber pfeilii]|nr:hypothetical protein BDZ91DRAFT_730972 [Kalaharituber pfeilii]
MKKEPDRFTVRGGKPQKRTVTTTPAFFFLLPMPRHELATVVTKTGYRLHLASILWLALFFAIISSLKAVSLCKDQT